MPDDIPEEILQIDNTKYPCFDPMLGYARKEQEDRETKSIPGYEIWPVDLNMHNADIRIMVLGGSTSDRIEGCNWPCQFADIARGKGVSALVINGGCGGYNSTQEMLKLFRDGPALKPDLVVALSGLNDIDFYHSYSATAPFVSGYQVQIGKYIINTSEAFNWIALGLPNRLPDYEIWLRNTRITKHIATDMGAQYCCFLQPGVGVGEFVPDSFELKLIEQANRVVTPLSRKKLLKATENFYQNIRNHLAEHPHIIDVSNVFKGMSKIYRDVRHPNEHGNKILAERIFRELDKRNVFERR